MLGLGGGAPAPDADWRRRWAALIELGVTGFCVPEDRGGFGSRADAAVATAVELGAALHGSPYAGLTASAHALAHAAEPDGGAHELLGGILTGDRVCAFGRLDVGGGGVARVVDGAPEADALLLEDPGSGDLVLLADPSAWSVDASRHTFDVSRTCGDVTIDVASGRRVAANPVASDLYGLLLAADAIGGVRRMLDRTVAYAAQRRAFGHPIGSFQAVQHRLVDHTVRARGMALAVTEAARQLGAGSPDARRAVAVAQVGVSSGATHILHDLVQLTGAIGFTWEYGLHFYERRAHQDARLAANPRAAVRTLAEIEGWTGAS